MYRQADRLLVNDQALVLCLSYMCGTIVNLIKPWVKNFPQAINGFPIIQNICMEDH